MRLLPAIAALAAAGLAACSTVATREALPFTDAMARDYGLGDLQKRRLPYYTSATIRLVRLPQSRTASGPNRDRNDDAATGVTLPAGTQGTVVGMGAGWMALRFQPGRWLYFACRQDPHGGNDDGRYYLYSPAQGEPTGSVQFGEARYQALGESFDSYLVIDRASLQDGERRETTLSSRWLDERVRP